MSLDLHLNSLIVIALNLTAPSLTPTALEHVQVLNVKTLFFCWTHQITKPQSYTDICKSLSSTPKGIFFMLHPSFLCYITKLLLPIFVINDFSIWSENLFSVYIYSNHKLALDEEKEKLFFCWCSEGKKRNEATWIFFDVHRSVTKGKRNLSLLIRLLRPTSWEWKKKLLTRLNEEINAEKKVLDFNS